MIKLPETKFKELKACIINIKIKPKEIDPEIKIFFKKIFKLKVIAKKSGIKKEESCFKSAWVIFSG